MQYPIAAWPLERPVRQTPVLARPSLRRLLATAGVALVALFAAATVPALAATAPATNTALSQLPLSQLNVAEPAMIFAIDDSGSMDWEVLLSTNQGEAYWQGPSAGSLLAALLGGTIAGGGVVDATGTPYYSTNNAYFYLFPFGGNGRSTMPPTPDFAVMRNAAFNPLYYNPSITYLPWTPAWHNGALMSFPQASFTAALTHPLYGTAPGINLGASQSGNFTFYAGAIAPASQLASCLGLLKVPVPGTSNVMVLGNGNCTLNFVPATYYINVPVCPAGATCATAPNGQIQQQVVVTSTSSEAQNFANWFTYYRQRITLLASSMSAVLPNVTNLRAGGVKFSNRVAPTMVDFSSTNPATNQKALLDLFYTAVPNGNTPTVTTLNYVGGLYQNDTSQAYIQAACQRNAVMIVTDGFANDYALGGQQTLSPAFFSTNGGASSTPPYDITYTGSLAGVAATYYNPAKPLGNPAFTPGLVPPDANASALNADLNTNLHLNTYAMMLGAKGYIFGTGSPEDTLPFTNITNQSVATSWRKPVSNDPSAIDDLYHASINGRGKTVVVTNSQEATSSIQNILADLLNRANAAAPVVLSSPNLAPGDNTAYLTSYNPAAWFGDLQAVAVDPGTGTLGGNPLWSLQANLDVPNSWTKRLFATSSGGKGVAFPAGISTSMLASSAGNDGDCVANYLMGDRSNEVGNLATCAAFAPGSPGVYRPRVHVLGDLVDAAPVLVKNQPTWSGLNDSTYSTFAAQIASRTSTIYQGGNDGMLHAVDAATGTELWNYIPSPVLPRLPLLVNPAYNHAFMVDGTPRVADVKTANGWSTLLVGGLRAGGVGYYALDVTTPAAANSAAAATKLQWEFPNPNTPAASAAGVGYSYGRPLIANTAAGYVVLVTSGYDNPDFQGHLFALDPATGNVLADLNTVKLGAGSSAAPAGLAMFTAFSPDGLTATRAYAGDLNGNLFAFDLSAANPAQWSVRLLARLTDASGNPQPITATPAVTLSNGNPYVYVGTGRLLDRSDVVSNPQTQSVYALTDDGVTTYNVAAARASTSPLLQQTVTVQAGGLRTSSQAVLNTQQRGWYLDLPPGEEITVDMLLAGQTLVFNTNAPQAAACSTSSYQYRLDGVSGSMQAAALFPAGTTPFAGQQLGTALASAPVLAVLTSGQWVSETRLGTGAVVTEGLPVVNGTALRKQGWREIRQ